MIPFEEALRTVLDSARRLGSERVDIANTINRILAEDAKSDMDMPPFNKSAMDGYACRRADLANELEVVETEPGFKGDTATGGSKSAKLETGLTIQIPLFINEGDVIKVDTRTGTYLERSG